MAEEENIPEYRTIQNHAYAYALRNKVDAGLGFLDEGKKKKSELRLFES